MNIVEHLAAEEPDISLRRPKAELKECEYRNTRWPETRLHINDNVVFTTCLSGPQVAKKKSLIEGLKIYLLEKWARA